MPQRIYGRQTEIGYDIADSIASQNLRIHLERKAKNPAVMNHDFNDAFTILFPELKRAR